MPDTINLTSSILRYVETLPYQRKPVGEINFENNFHSSTIKGNFVFCMY